LADFIEYQAAEAPAESVGEALVQEGLASALEALPPRESIVLQLRHGLVDGESYTLEEIGRKLGVTRERVRQIEAQALRRLRDPRLRRQLRDLVQG